MKTCFHKNRINEALSKFHNISGISFPDAIKIIQSIEVDLLALLPELQAMENDYRLGNDTYGYKEDEILVSLEYISDRWQSAFRIAWLLGLVNQDYR